MKRKFQSSFMNRPHSRSIHIVLWHRHRESPYAAFALHYEVNLIFNVTYIFTAMHYDFTFIIFLMRTRQLKNYVRDIKSFARGINQNTYHLPFRNAMVPTGPYILYIEKNCLRLLIQPLVLQIAVTVIWNYDGIAHDLVFVYILNTLISIFVVKRYLLS